MFPTFKPLLFAVASLIYLYLGAPIEDIGNVDILSFKPKKRQPDSIQYYLVFYVLIFISLLTEGTPTLYINTIPLLFILFSTKRRKKLQLKYKRMIIAIAMMALLFWCTTYFSPIDYNFMGVEEFLAILACPLVKIYFVCFSTLFCTLWYFSKKYWMCYSLLSSLALCVIICGFKTIAILINLRIERGIKQFSMIFPWIVLIITIIFCYAFYKIFIKFLTSPSCLVSFLLFHSSFVASTLCTATMLFGDLMHLPNPDFIFVLVGSIFQVISTSIYISCYMPFWIS